MTTKQNIRILIAAFLALGVVFGVCACQGPKPNVPYEASTPAPK